mmetsp:Transcript_15560/g.43392  ORF Transcript_15560/g.43392 Transcript_15560/m.43392 type:complete len:246 (-) Transcript_15560:832-1569(-)
MSHMLSSVEKRRPSTVLGRLRGKQTTPGWRDPPKLHSGTRATPRSRSPRPGHRPQSPGRALGVLPTPPRQEAYPRCLSPATPATTATKLRHPRLPAPRIRRRRRRCRRHRCRRGASEVAAGRRRKGETKERLFRPRPRRHLGRPSGNHCCARRVPTNSSSPLQAATAPLRHRRPPPRSAKSAPLLPALPPALLRRPPPLPRPLQRPPPPSRLRQNFCRHSAAASVALARCRRPPRLLPPESAGVC